MGFKIDPYIISKHVYSRMERIPFKIILENHLSRIAQKYFGKNIFTVKINFSDDYCRSNFNIRHLDGFCVFLKIFKQEDMSQFIGGLELINQPLSFQHDKSKIRKACVLMLHLSDLEGYREKYRDEMPAIRKEVGLDPELPSLFPQLPKQP